jgi:hypothetical protein
MITKIKPNKSARTFISYLSALLRPININEKIKGPLKATPFYQRF